MCDRDREAGRQTDRQTGRQTERERERERRIKRKKLRERRETGDILARLFGQANALQYEYKGDRNGMRLRRQRERETSNNTSDGSKIRLPLPWHNKVHWLHPTILCI